MGGGVSKKSVVGTGTHRVTTVNGAMTIGSYVSDKPTAVGEDRNYPEAGFGCDLEWSDIRIEREIGKGNFGAVYAGHVHGKFVAIKRLYLDEQSANTITSDFRKEVSILEVVHHPNIVRYLGAVNKSPVFALVFEYCEGSVATFLRMVATQTVDVTWDLLLSIALGAAEAIRYMHESSPQVLHRDIKAENMLLTQEFVVKVTDFGLSRIVQNASEARHMTVCGSVLWVAPEIMHGEAYNSAVDVYSYGITMWELLNFERPFKEYSSADIPYLVAERNLRPDIRPHTPRPLGEFVTRCWNANPAERPTFANIVEELRDMPNRFDTTATVDLMGGHSATEAFSGR